MRACQQPAKVAAFGLNNERGKRKDRKRLAGYGLWSFLRLQTRLTKIAFYAGAVYETYFKVSQELSEQGLIQTEGKK